VEEDGVKIGINTLFLIPREVGGSETYLMEILREWEKQSLPHEWVLFTNQENHELLSSEFSGDGWQCMLCPFNASNRIVRILREQFELPRKVRKSGVEVLWSPGYTTPFFSACPQVVSILDMQYKRFPQDLSFLGRWTTEILVQMAGRRARAFLTISEFSKQEILQYTHAKAEQITVSPLAADPVFAKPMLGEVSVKKPYLLCVANSYPHKNVDQFIRAFARLEEEIPHQLVFVGRPRLGEPAVQEALQQIQDSNRVTRLSGITREELVRLYQQAAIFVFPSLYEGFGLPVLEALYADTPVVTTRCGSIPEVGGDFVHYVDETDDEAWAETIRLCLAEKHESADTKRQAWLDQFSWRKTAQRSLACLVEASRSA
jgi:glycosyltransferase involved in cell wall biosynthesis